MKTDVIVIGGGASGMMAAGTCAKRGKRVLLIEKMPRTGRKILVTGKGRCNVTNDCDGETVMKNIISNPKFMFSALKNWSPENTIRFFEDLGVELKTERGRRVFPVSDRAMDIADALADFCKQNGVKVITDTVTELMLENNAVSGVKTLEKKEIYADSVIVATGGLSYSRTGSTGDGYEFAKKAGHTVVTPHASLVGINLKGNDFKQMQGLSLKNTNLSLFNKNGKCVYKELGEMLFTHFGISGPLALTASAYLGEHPENFYVELDFKPALSTEKLNERIERDFSENINRDFMNSLDALLPRLLIPRVIEKSGIPEHKKVNQITRQQRQNLCKVIKHYRLDIIGVQDIDTAIITAGGVSAKEIDPKTMQSKLVKGLYFAGEVIDVDAVTGGFNLQIAFSTGVVAGNNA